MISKIILCLFVSSMAWAVPQDGSILLLKNYDFPAFADSGFLQTPEIEKYYETVIKDKFNQTIAVTQIQRLDYASDGLLIKGFVLTPKNATSKIPILVFNRGGNRDYGKLTVKDMIWLSRFAQKGFVVVASQYRGNDGGQGKDEFGGKDVHDVLNLIIAAKNLAHADTQHIFVMGHSRGGMESYLTLKADHEIKALAVLSGECDLKRGLEAWPDFEKNVYAELIPDYYAHKDQALSERSACEWPEQITAPVLIFQGSIDQNVQPDQATEIAAKLKSVGTPYRLRMIDDQDHNFYFRDQFADPIATEVADWFHSWIK